MLLRGGRAELFLLLALELSVVPESEARLHVFNQPCCWSTDHLLVSMLAVKSKQTDFNTVVVQ